MSEPKVCRVVETLFIRVQDVEKLHERLRAKLEEIERRQADKLMRPSEGPAQ